jgi:hypothetical protein
MKKAVMSLLVGVAAAAMCHAATISITFPNGGEQLPLKNFVLIGWQHGGTIDESLVKIVLFKGGTDSAHKVGNIVQNIPIGNSLSATYNWQAGAYKGGFAGPGHDYYIKIITMDGNFSDFSNNPFSIVLPKIPIERYREYVELNPDPDCPMCGVFDIGALLAELGNPPPDLIGNLVILRGGRQVGLLGRLGRGGLSANQTAKLQFAAEDFSLLGKQNQGFEVAIMGAQGNILKRRRTP